MAETRSCKNCTYSDDRGDYFVCMGQRFAPRVDCGGVCDSWKNKTYTNADKLRSLPDVELAQWICHQIIDRNIGVPLEAWLEWLRSEVTANG